MASIEKDVSDNGDDNDDNYNNNNNNNMIFTTVTRQRLVNPLPL
jgi:hypothetical protein